MYARGWNYVLWLSMESFIEIALEWSILVVPTSYLYENNAKMLYYILLLSVNFCWITKNTINLTANLWEPLFGGKKPLYFGFYQEIYNIYIFFYYFMLKSTKFHSEKKYFFDILDICVCVMCVRLSIYSWNYVLFRARIVLFKLP